MAAATGVTRSTAPFLSVGQGEFTLDPGAIAAGANEDQTVAVAEAKVGDGVIVAPQAALTNGLVVTGAHVSADGTITFTIENHTSGSVDAASATWNYTLIRGNNGILAAG